jgi:hypothetical protein
MVIRTNQDVCELVNISEINGNVQVGPIASLLYELDAKIICLASIGNEGISIKCYDG